jgi:hypothetical protein
MQLFETGKTYRMTGGGWAKIALRRKTPLIGISSVPRVRCWSLDGRFSSSSTDFDLVPNRSAAEPPP